MSARPTRRELALGALGLPLLVGARDALAGARGDVAILRVAVDLEQKAVFTYEAAAGRLDSRTARLATLFRDQEQKHADGLTMALRNRGGHPPAKPASPREVPGLEQALRGGRGTILRFAVSLEETAVAAYHDALGNFRDGRLRFAAATIIGNEGQHLAVLREALGEQPVPGAFEAGGR